MRILLIEDDLVMATLIKHALQSIGCTFDHFTNGQKAWSSLQINKNNYSLLILDIMLPGIDGLKLCRLARQNDISIPILMLSQRDLVHDKVTGLRAGADDYLVKPFAVEELLARVQAILRRQNDNYIDIVNIGNLKINPHTFTATLKKKNLHLTATEFRILHLLVLHIDKIVTRTEIINKVWNNQGDDLFSNTVDVHIRKLRIKLKHSKFEPIISAIHGIGYKFNASFFKKQKNMNK